MVCSNDILKNKFVLCGLGISNKSVKSFFDSNNIEYYIFDENSDFNINENYIVIKSPGIPSENSFIKKCLANDILVITDIELFYMLRKDIKIIGVTGTVGKTTCTTILYNILNKKYNINIAGNIGIPIFEYINQSIDYLIVELSSFQLEFIKCFKPFIFIILNFHPHHLNHHITIENYLEAKLRTIDNLKEDDVLVINNKLIPHLSDRNVICKVNTFSNSLNVNFNSVINSENINAIKETIKYFSISEDEFINELESFKGIEHRYEEIKYPNNVLIINDSKSTSFISLNDAIRKCSQLKDYDHRILIFGGKLDQLEIEENIGFIKSIKDFKLYLYGENRFTLSKICNEETFCTEYLKDIITKIKIEPNTLILFSPAAQSLDQFKSYIERGNVFKDLIDKKLNK